MVLQTKTLHSLKVRQWHLWVLISIAMLILAEVISLHAVVNKLMLAVEDMATMSTLRSSFLISKIGSPPFPRKVCQWEVCYPILTTVSLSLDLGLSGALTYPCLYLTKMDKQRAPYLGSVENSGC